MDDDDEDDDAWGAARDDEEGPPWCAAPTPLPNCSGEERSLRSLRSLRCDEFCRARIAASSNAVRIETPVFLAHRTSMLASKSRSSDSFSCSWLSGSNRQKGQCYTELRRKIETTQGECMLRPA